MCVFPKRRWWGRSVDGKQIVEWLETIDSSNGGREHRSIQTVKPLVAVVWGRLGSVLHSTTLFLFLPLVVLFLQTAAKSLSYSLSRRSLQMDRTALACRHSRRFLPFIHPRASTRLIDNDDSDDEQKIASTITTKTNKKKYEEDTLARLTTTIISLIRWQRQIREYQIDSSTRQKFPGA